MKKYILLLSFLFLAASFRPAAAQDIKSNLLYLWTLDGSIHKGTISSWSDSAIALQTVVSRPKKSDSLTNKFDTFRYSQIREIKMTRAKIDQSSRSAGMIIGLIGGAALGAVAGYSIAYDDINNNGSGCANDDACNILNIYCITGFCGSIGAGVGIFTGTLAGNMASSSKRKAFIQGDYLKFQKAKTYFKQRYKLAV